MNKISNVDKEKNTKIIMFYYIFSIIFLELIPLILMYKQIWITVVVPIFSLISTFNFFYILFKTVSTIFGTKNKYKYLNIILGVINIILSFMIMEYIGSRY